MSEKHQHSIQPTELLEIIKTAEQIPALEQFLKSWLIEKLHARLVYLCDHPVRMQSGCPPPETICSVSDAFCEAHGISPTAVDNQSPAAQYLAKHGVDLPLLIDQCKWGVENGLLSPLQLEGFTAYWRSAR